MRRLPALTAALLLPAATAAADAGARYYAEFDPARRPWQPATELNFEEVYQRYEYFEIRDAAGGTLAVTHHQRGQPPRTVRYQRQPDGALRTLPGAAK